MAVAIAIIANDRPAAARGRAVRALLALFEGAGSLGDAPGTRFEEEVRKHGRTVRAGGASRAGPARVSIGHQLKRGAVPPCLAKTAFCIRNGGIGKCLARKTALATALRLVRAGATVVACGTCSPRLHSARHTRLTARKPLLPFEMASLASYTTALEHVATARNYRLVTTIARATLGRVVDDETVRTHNLNSERSDTWCGTPSIMWTAAQVELEVEDPHTRGCHHGDIASHGRRIYGHMQRVLQALTVQLRRETSRIRQLFTTRGQGVVQRQTLHIARSEGNVRRAAKYYSQRAGARQLLP
mmetsp:Transcript_10717/g.29696  ORF Transcript_10717/g.29696 Transcript_10717/m.29696 type:complete len:301 (-) Transcript_10717:224-1126(-)|eukprot:scaffold286661_cov26-Tisochrysis_lutea.AAC.10